MKIGLRPVYLFCDEYLRQNTTVIRSSQYYASFIKTWQSLGMRWTWVAYNRLFAIGKVNLFCLWIRTQEALRNLGHWIFLSKEQWRFETLLSNGCIQFKAILQARLNLPFLIFLEYTAIVPCYVSLWIGLGHILGTRSWPEPVAWWSNYTLRLAIHDPRIVDSILNQRHFSWHIQE